MPKKQQAPWWDKRFAYMLEHVKNPLRKLRLWVKKKCGWLGLPQILPFRGFGNANEIYLKGRLLENSGLITAEKEDSIWENLLSMIKRYTSDELPGLRICARFNGLQKVIRTDDSGLFEFYFRLPEPLPPETEWIEIDLELLDRIIENQEPVKVKAEVLIAQQNSEFGIISDVDDTIMISHATRFFKKVRLMLLKNARTRMPFEGVAGFYRALYQGREGIKNPIFYVSSSEWNLYDLLIDFCVYQGIPKGPFLLRRLATRFYHIGRGSGSHDHKIEKIRHIIQVFKGLKFILIGDSGQQDPEIYSRIAHEAPECIAAIYIRDVHPSRHKAVLSLAHDLQKLHIEMVMVKDTMEAARHALQMGFISEKYMHDIAVEKYKDKHTPGDLKQLITEKLHPTA